MAILEGEPAARKENLNATNNGSPTSPGNLIVSEEPKFEIEIIAAALDPDPTDHLNPQNWPRWKKTSLFVALMSSSILCDGGMTWGASLFVANATEWHIPMSLSTTSANYGILLQGFGGIFGVPLIEHYGRFPVWFWSQLITLGMMIGATSAPSFHSFVAFRSLQGLFGTVPQVVGLPIIHDMYKPEDWPRMINFWNTTFLVGPFAGPAIAGYLGTVVNWRGAFGVLTGLYGFSTLLVILFGRETYYVTHKPASKAPTWSERFLGQGGALAVERPNLVATSMTLIKFIFKVPLLLVGVSTMINFTWPIGITVTVDSFIRAPPYLMDDIPASSMRWCPVLGSLAGFALGYFFNEWLARTRVHRADWTPEFRLHGIWLPAFSMVCGLLTYGLSINYHRHWVGLAFGWFFVNLGLIGSMVAITSFALEKYAENSTVVSAVLNMWRTCGGFSVSYFQPSWVARAGVAAVFGSQAAIVAVTVVLLIGSALILGKKGANSGVRDVGENQLEEKV